ncbi:hypothetical protein [Streptomyces sp. NPDC001880]
MSGARGGGNGNGDAPSGPGSRHGKRATRITVVITGSLLAVLPLMLAFALPQLFRKSGLTADA